MGRKEEGDNKISNNSTAMIKQLKQIDYILKEISPMLDLAQSHVEEAKGVILKGPANCPAHIKDIERIFGKFEYEDLGKGQIRIDKKWLVENCRLYYFRYQDIDTKFYLHRLVAPQFMGMVTEIYTSGFGPHFDIYKNGGGVFAERRKYHNPKSNLSKHCWPGIAIDNDPPNYPVGSDKRQPEPLIAICRKWGYHYGGDFKTRKDPMHFEWCSFVT